MFLLLNCRFVTFENTLFLFSFPFLAFAKISSKTRFCFEHFLEPCQNLVSVFLVIFCFFPVILVFSPLFFYSFFPVFYCFSLKNYVSCLVSFPIYAHISSQIPSRFSFLAHFLSQILSCFPFLSPFLTSNRLVFKKTCLAHPYPCQ